MPSFGGLIFGSASFTGLVGGHVCGMLLVTAGCSTFVLRSSKQISRRVFGRCASLDLHCPPHFARIAARRRTLTRLGSHGFRLVVYVPGVSGHSVFTTTARVGVRCPGVPVMILAPFSGRMSGQVTGRSLDTVSCIFD